jgi:uroporphyrinogen decarboxylase
MNQIGPHSISLWRHFYDREKTAEQLTPSMIEWQEKWRWDFLKINPAACYHVLDWGAEYQFFDDPLLEPKLLKPVVTSGKDVDKIKAVDVHAGALGDQLRVIRNLRSHFGPDLPIVETVFAPIEIAHRLMESREQLLQIRKRDPEALHRLLKTITQVFQKFCVAALEAGADGIFFATKWANQDLMSWADYEEFGKQYDLRILHPLFERNALLILHVCGPRTYLQKMLDYPALILSYDFFAEDVPDPVQLVQSSGKFVLGGVDQDRLKSDLEGVVQRCIQYKTLRKWIVGPSCVVPVDTPDDLIRRFLTETLPHLRG